MVFHWLMAVRTIGMYEAMEENERRAYGTKGTSEAMEA